RSVEEVARVLGVSRWSLYQWSKRYGRAGAMKHNRRPGDRSVGEKLKAVIEFEGLQDEKQGEYLRREGLQSEHIAGWKKSMEAGLKRGGCRVRLSFLDNLGRATPSASWSNSAGKIRL
ncbi:MAG: hypothetical protein U1E51_10895, partial [Candidatus Binatia bacterium]|nr:hypothetical protein [Candidatus Binatia bacterium]